MGDAVIEITAWQLFLMGGPLMWPIVVLSIFLLATIMDRCFTFSLMDKDVPVLKEKVFAEVRKNNIKGAIVACDISRSITSRLFKAGLIKFGGSKEDIVQAMDEVITFEVPQLERFLPAMATISQVAPLLGLLGTVLGLASTFHIIQVHAQALNPVTVADIARGVWQSFVTTVSGLVVGIAAVIAYNHFCARLELALRRVEKNAADLVTFMLRVSEMTDPDEKE